VVFDGPPDQLDDTVLTQIYGEEDWTAIDKVDTDEDDESGVDEERLAGLA